MWALRGPLCIPISGHDAGEPGVFATLEECEQTCPGVPSKFENLPGRKVYLVPEVGDITYGLCRLSFDAGVAVMTCYWWE